MVFHLYQVTMQKTVQIRHKGDSASFANILLSYFLHCEIILWSVSPTLTKAVSILVLSYVSEPSFLLLLVRDNVQFFFISPKSKFLHCNRCKQIITSLYLPMQQCQSISIHKYIMFNIRSFPFLSLYYSLSKTLILKNNACDIKLHLNLI